LSRVGMANVYVDRGNLPAAQGALDALIADVVSRTPTDGPLRDVLARAHHDRGVVAYYRADFPTAAAFIHAAIDEYTDEDRKSRALVDLGTVMVDLGHPAAAHDAYFVAYQTAPDPFHRWMTGVNLMRVAFLRGHETLFARMRHELAAVDLPAPIEALYHQVVGQGLHSFGRDEAARDALERAVDVATRYQLNKIRLESEAILTEIVLRRPPKPVLLELPASPLVEPVVRALHDMRQRVSV
jgi:hypothetical protein